jgi:hypothetical protein
MSSSNSVSVVEHGGVTQMAHGAAPVAPAQQHGTSQHNDGRTIRSTPNGMESSGVTRTNSSEMRPEGAGILATARNAFSGGFAQDLNAPSTRLVHEGMEIDVASAVRLGLVQKDANGNYSETVGGKTNEAAPAAEGGEDQAAADAAQAFEPATEATVVDFANHFAPQVQDALIGHIIDGVGIDQATAEQAGMTVEHASGMAGVAVAAFTGQARAHIEKAGANFDEFSTWVNANEPTLLKDAMRQHVYSRNPNVYGELVGKYLRAVQPTTAAVVNAGHRVSTHKDSGSEMIEINGITTTLKTATRMGWV